MWSNAPKSNKAIGDILFNVNLKVKDACLLLSADDK